MRTLRAVILLLMVLPGACRGLVIDHTCTDLSQLPYAWIDSVQANCRMHYCHTSHGSQLSIGAQTISDTSAVYGFADDWCELPTQPGAFCVHDGQVDNDYITPDLYWQTSGGMNTTRQVLTANPSLNYGMWGWCTQLDYYDSLQVAEYLDSMAALEAEFPGVTFVYMTGNAQDSSEGGWNRHQRNEQIRAHCQSADRVLFDFADLDCWHDGGQHLVSAGGHVFPAEHPHYNGDEAAHTTVESCVNKGRAWWWLMARLAGWPGPSGVAQGAAAVPAAAGFRVWPNPLRSLSQLRFSRPGSYRVFNALGQLVASGDGGALPDRPAPAGIYFVRAAGGGPCRRLVVIR